MDKQFVMFKKFSILRIRLWHHPTMNKLLTASIVTKSSYIFCSSLQNTSSMRWNLTQSTDQFNRWKLEQNETAEIKYNKESQSFRITASDKRLFFIDKTGFFQNRFLIRTEYSVITAEILPKKMHSGVVIFENKKYHYERVENSMVVSRSKDDLSFPIEINDIASLDQPQLYALLFSTLRIVVCQLVLA
jgi:hypothetical protein